MDVLLDALFGLVAGDRRQPKMDLFVAIVAMVFGMAAALLLHTRLFDSGWAGFAACLATPAAATFLVATLLSRPYPIRGAILAAGIALIMAFPLAVLHLMFGLWA
jgi:hypothetical protein